MELFLFFPIPFIFSLLLGKREYTASAINLLQGGTSMELFRPAGICRTDPDSRDWTREHGYAKASASPFPTSIWTTRLPADPGGPRCPPLLQPVPAPICQPRIRPSVLLGLVENFLNRDVHQKNTWMRGNYPSPAWGEIRLEIFYDMGLFHLEDVPPRALALEQSRKEAAHTADLP